VKEMLLLKVERGRLGESKKLKYFTPFIILENVTIRGARHNR
jgi:hypothetical protein